MITKNKFIFIFFITFTIMLLLKDLEITRPLFFYITSIHELCHAYMAIFTGGNVHQIDLYATGGHTITSGGIFILISLAGYIGTTFIGAILVYLSNKENLLKIFLTIFSIIVIFSYFIYIKSFFNLYFMSTLIISGIIMYLSTTKFASILGLTLGSIFIIDSFSDAKIYLFSKLMGQSNIIYNTDAGILARELGTELLTLPIALGIFSINMYILYILIKNVLKKDN